MAVWRKREEIEDLVARLERRGVMLYHACQFKDFKSYLKAGGIASREKLITEGLPFTRFETDELDQSNSVWNLVFANLEDFGNAFASGRVATPNTYGPILLEIRPAALREAIGVAIFLESGGSPAFDWERDQLTNMADVENLFRKPNWSADGTANEPLSRGSEVAWRRDLRERFERDHVSGPDLCAEFPSGVLSVHHIERAVVDPYRVGNWQLVNVIQAYVKHYGFELPVERRSCDTPARQPLYGELGKLLQTGSKSEWMDVVCGVTPVSDALAEWWRALRDRNGDGAKQFPRYAKYLAAGTLTPGSKLKRLPLSKASIDSIKRAWRTTSSN